MSGEKLKRVRVAVSLIFLASISVLFLDARHSIPPAVGGFLVSLQFVPSLLRLFTYFDLTAVGLILVFALTVAFGRVYCSFLCPLGTLQDIVIHIEKKIHRRKRFTYGRPPFAFHYSVLVLTGLFVCMGSMTLLNILEPFSIYGRIVTGTAEPLVTLLNNGIAGIFAKFQVYFLYSIPLREAGISVLVFSLAILALVVTMSYRHGRLFCNSLCPAGALLGLISRISFVKIVIDRSACNDCGACEKVCKASCIDSGAKRIDFGACVGCFNCIKSCPTDGVIYSRVRFALPQKAAPEYNPERRVFFKGVLAPTIGLALPAFMSGDSTSTSTDGYHENRNHPISPPGSKSIRHFSGRCTACHLCVSACPSQVLTPAFLDYGFAGVFQPRMNYDAGYCNYDCTVCGQVCPTGAILPAGVESKKLIQIGRAMFVKDDCIVVSKKMDCAACSEHCPTKAVYTVPYEGKLSIPELNNDICVGCGACEHACPTTPRKAIYVRANPVHLVAKRPPVKKQENAFDSNKDFPF